MNQLALLPAAPALVAGDKASMRFLEFFAANILNPNTRRTTAAPCGNFWHGRK